MTVTADPAARWRAHFLKHGPRDQELRETLLAVASYADLEGRTRIIDEEQGTYQDVRLAPCRACGLGLDA